MRISRKKFRTFFAIFVSRPTLEFRIQLKESGYQVLLTKIPDSSYCVWYPESKTVLEFPFTGRKRQCAGSKKIVSLVVLGN